MDYAVIELANLNNGFVTAEAAAQAGISGVVLSRAVDSGRLKKVSRGLYGLPDVWDDEYLIAANRYKRGVLSHSAALYLLGLSDEAPEKLTMTFPRGYNPSSAASIGIIPKTVSPELLGLGKVEVISPFGNMVPVYNAERSLCDMFRGEAIPDKQILIPAMKTYLASDNKNVPELLTCAEMLGVISKVRNYVEVLL